MGNDPLQPNARELMPDQQTWRPSKAELHNGRWRASRNPKEVAVGSRIITDLIVEAYGRLLKTHARGILVDVGCGKAPYFGMYRDHVTASVGVDWDQSVHESGQVDVKCNLNEHIDLPDAYADTILCTDVLEHIFAPQKTWNEISRILKPGGKAIVGVPFFYWIHEAPHDYHRYTSFALRKYAAEANLEVQVLEVAGGLPFVAADLLCKAAGRRPYQLVVEIACRALLAILARRPPRVDTPFPLAYVLVAAKPAL